jgi:uncharacterized protein YkwD
MATLGRELAAERRTAQHRGVSRRFWAVLMWLLLLPHATVRADELPCTPDDELSQAAASLLLANGQPNAAQLMAAVQAAGSDAVALHAVFVKTDADSALRAWLIELRTRSDTELICGLAVSETGRLLIASARAGSLAPISPDVRIVRGRLSPGFDRPELVIASANGKLTRIGAGGNVLTRGLALGADFVAPIKVQLVARGPAGPRPVAERSVAASAALAADSNRDLTPAEPQASVEPPASRSAVERDDLVALVMELRRARRRPSVHDNRLLREAASEYARRVCRDGRVAHELEQGSGPEGRLTSAGLTARLVGEAIARAADAKSALVALERSPSHLLTLLEPRFTDIGIGRARDAQGKSCFVVLLCAWPRYVGH